ncbi:hypothetical protein WA538_002254, partial [Blastocystis sp. DL]
LSFADHIHEIPKSEIILGQHLGSGCSGHVYAGAYNGQPVAIKQFICKNENNLPSILHELEILALMDHPNVLALYGYVLDKHDIWVITELAKCDLLQLLGPSTSDGLKETTLPYKTRKAYIRQIANGLLYTITHGIIHQDLKLDNLLLAQNGQIKIADFGLSQLTKKSTDFSTHSFAQGNYLHKSPEIWLLEFDACPESKRALILTRSNVYTLGILIMEIYVGYVEMKAWKGAESREVTGQSIGFLMYSGFRLRPVEELQDDPVIYGIVRDCLKEVEERPDIQEVSRRIDAWCQQ